jgi:ABC-type uncharacterized transport system involved in gliding motility auxiliary subunit
VASGIDFHNRNMRAILVAAAVLLAALGLVFCYVEQRLHWAGVVCFISGVGLGAAFLFSGGALRTPGTKACWAGRVWGVALTLLVLLTWFLINAGAARFSWRLDLTRARQHTLTPATADFIQNLPGDIEITALVPGFPPSYLEDLFREYERLSSGRITTAIIDPVQEIGYAARFGNIIDGRQEKVVVQSGKERRDVDFSDKPLSEEQLTNAIVRVTRPPRQACFLTGHQEPSLQDKSDQGLSRLAELLEASNIHSRELLLAQENRVAEDCDVLVIAGPRDELTAADRGHIDFYMKAGGDVLFMIEHVVVTTPDQPLNPEDLRRNPSLNELLNSWGLRIGDDIVVDLVSHAGEDVGSPATRNYLPHKAITQGLDYTFFVRPRSISLVPRRPTIKLVPAILTATEDKSWGETSRTLKVFYDEGIDVPGPVALAYVGMEDKEGAERSDTRFMVFTDADFLTNAYIDQYSNGALGMNAINWLSELDYRVFQDRKGVKIEALNLTSRQKRVVASILFLLPVGILVAGLLVWLRRG